MVESREAWSQVGDRLSALLLKIKLHAQEELSAEELKSTEGLETLRAAFSEAMDALGDAYQDDAVREDAREAGRAFVQAMDATSRAVQERLRSSGS